MKRVTKLSIYTKFYVTSLFVGVCSKWGTETSRYFDKNKKYEKLEQQELITLNS
jgi:hypothetical protein